MSERFTRTCNSSRVRYLRRCVLSSWRRVAFWKICAPATKDSSRQIGIQRVSPRAPSLPGSRTRFSRTEPVRQHRVRTSPGCRKTNAARRCCSPGAVTVNGRKERRGRKSPLRPQKIQVSAVCRAGAGRHIHASQVTLHPVCKSKYFKIHKT